MTSVFLFRLGTVCYVVSAYLYLVTWFPRYVRGRRWATFLLTGAVIFHAATMVKRTLEIGYPFFNLQELLSVYTLALALLHLLTEWRFGYTLLGVMVIPIGGVLILLASLLPQARVPLLSLLQSVTLMTHVSVFLTAYAAFTLAFAAALAYLLQARALRQKRLAWRLPPLRVMDRLCGWLITVGILLMLSAMLFGSIWAETVWDTPWIWEPKQVMSLVTLSIYGLYFSVRHTGRWSGRRLAWLVVLGFLSVLVTFVGADLLAPDGLHSFLF
jgi:ABC-type transport system involved in cytochrome c biogenesis permease subunit